MDAQGAATRAENRKTQVRDELVAALTTELPKIVEDKAFHPASRLNAVILLRDLNPAKGNSLKISTPIPVVVPLLRKWVSDRDMLEAVRVSSLKGLMQSARATGGLVESERRLLVRELIDIANAKPIDDAKRRDGQVWLRRDAIDVLRILATNGTEASSAEVAAALTAVAAAPEVDLGTRSAAAAALGAFDANALLKDTIPACRQSLLGFMAASAKDAQVVALLENSEAASPDAKAAALPSKSKDLARKRLQHHLSSGVQGLQGVKGLTPERGLRVATDDAGKKELDDVAAKAALLIAAAGDRKVAAEELVKQMRAFASDIENRLNPPAAEPAAAAVEAEAGGN
jgi:hypothetical protein